MNETITLDDITDKHIGRFIAPISFLCLLLIFGIPGNLAVLFIYATKYSKCVFRVLICNLAVVDLIFCTLGIPFNIARIVHYYTFDGRWACKIITAVIVFGFMYSAHLVMLLSVHRFRQICYSMKTQISVRNVHYFIIACLAIGLLLSWPQAVLIDIDELKVQNNITTRICPITAAHPSKYSIAYSTFNVCLFSIYTLILFVLYSLIARKVYLQRQKRHCPHTQTSDSNISDKMTKIAFTISVVFALSYIPLFLLKVAKDWFDERNINEVTFSTLKIAERFYIVNHVANPIIYAIFDKRFRRSIRNIASFKRGAESGSKDKRYNVDHSTDHTATDHTTSTTVV
ncbi:unnamed protein product [Mytilus coruscus]|uniref:G-protein coupled receptors family 1 profile domain-containing protein n=1 Tax=Mytilus coruscus TaxID=42192 RepID=A0A6J8ALE4_MYTCO|nr:unnamed protein product [Mytilus coruscus]